MKKFFDIRIIIIVVLVIVLGVMVKVYTGNQNNVQNVSDNFSKIDSNDVKLKNSSNSSSSKTIQTTAEITSELSEKIELHATYYFSECYVQENQEVKKGENILKYTNGTYLVAPYDCVITKLNIPSENKKCTNEHYIEVSAVNMLVVQVKVDEAKIHNFSIGQSAEIKVSALDNKEFEGYITKISSIASNGKFTITIQFDNDGDVKLGMTANIEI